MGSLLSHFVDSFPVFIGAAWTTVEVTFLSLVFAVFIGIVFALFSLSRFRLLKWLNVVYVWLIRGTPLILQIVILYYSLAQTLHINLDPITAGSAALAIHNGAYLSEIFRGAIESIARGQREAAQALGMSRSLAMRRVILPQAVRRAVPPMINQFIIGLKDSSLLAYIGVAELYNVSLGEASRTYDQTLWYSVAAIYYLAMTLGFTLLGRFFERRLDVSRKATKSRTATSANGKEVAL